MAKSAQKQIYLSLIDDAGETLDLDDIEEHLVGEFGVPVKPVNSTIQTRDFYDPQRNQYNSTGILKTMLTQIPEDALKMLGIVSVDLFIPILTFVFGEAQLDGPVGIVSLARLRQEYYGFEPNPGLLHRRLIKEIKHELGHTFGLVHCRVPDCVMTAANNIQAVDAKGIAFCRACKEHLRRST
jgi:archaemetzincin